MSNKKFYKVLFGNKSYASGTPFEYKIDELLVYDNFNNNPSVRDGRIFCINNRGSYAFTYKGHNII